MIQIQKGIKYVDNIESFWGHVATLENARQEALYYDLFNFISKMLSLPHSSAAAECVLF